MSENSKTTKREESGRSTEFDSYQSSLSSRDAKIRDLIEEMKKLNGEIWRMREENHRIVEEKEEREKENAMLKATIAGTEIKFSPDAWMRVEMEDMRLSTAKLNEKTTEVYRTIWEKGVMKAHCRSAEERKKLVEEIQTLEDLCEQITKHVKKAHRECIRQIFNHLYRSEEGNELADANDAYEEERPIDKFLGTYVSKESTRWMQVEIRKADLDDYYQHSWTDVKGNTNSYRWILNSDESSGYRVSIDGDVLSIDFCGNVGKYELCVGGLTYNGMLFIRS